MEQAAAARAAGRIVFDVFDVLFRDDMHADVAGPADDFVRQRGAEQFQPARTLPRRNHDVREIVGVRVVDHAIGGRRRGHGDRLATQPFGKAQGLGDAIAFFFGQALRTRRLDIDRRPRGAQPVGQPARIAHQRSATGPVADADQHALARLPWPLDGMRAHVVDHLRIDALGRAAQRQFAQGREIARHEVAAHGALGLFRDIDLAFLQPLDQVFRREVDQLDIVGTVENGIRHGLAHAHAA